MQRRLAREQRQQGARVGEAVQVQQRFGERGQVGLSSRVLTRHIGEFLAAYPDVQLKLIASNDAAAPSGRAGC